MEGHKYHPPKYSMAFQHLSNYFYMEGEDVQVTIKSDLASNCAKSTGVNQFSNELKTISEVNFGKGTCQTTQYDDLSVKESLTDNIYATS